MKLVHFGHAVANIYDQYLKVKRKFAEMETKKHDERHKFALAAEQRKVEEAQMAAEFEAKKRAALEALQKQILESRLDPHQMDDAWSKFHVHLVVKPIREMQAYCCTCRRRRWERDRNRRIAAEERW